MPKLNNSELIEKVSHDVTQARRHSAPWRKDAREDFDFVAGHQWSDDDKTILEEQGRPAVTFNRIDPIIESVQSQARIAASSVVAS